MMRIWAFLAAVWVSSVPAQRALGQGGGSAQPEARPAPSAPPEQPRPAARPGPGGRAGTAAPSQDTGDATGEQQVVASQAAGQQAAAEPPPARPRPGPQSKAGADQRRFEAAAKGRMLLGRRRHRRSRRGRRRHGSPFVLRRGSYVLELTGQIQVQGVLYLGSEALYENGDPASDEGVLIRRARLGVRGRLPYFFHYELTIEGRSDLARASSGDGLAGQSIGAELLDAYLVWRPWKMFGVGAGARKTFGPRGRMVSSRRLQLLERPLSVEALAVDRRPGVWILGDVRWFSYGLGFFNADKGLSFGNEGGGYMAALRMEVAPLGPMGNTFSDMTQPFRRAYRKVRIGAGTSFQYANGPATDRLMASADLGLKWHGLSVAVEGIVYWTRPSKQPTVPSALQEDVLGFGAYGQVGYFILPAQLEAAVRFEYFDENVHIDTAQDVWALTGVLNYYWTRFLRVQLAYTHKQEVHHAQVDNDALVVQAQAAF